MSVAKEYEDTNGKCPYAKWFNGLNAPAAAKVTKAVVKMQQGNFSNATPVGSGVHEYTIDFGPGYRIYFAEDGEEIIILLGGGSKKRQQRDIDQAIERWQDYKQRKRQGEK